MIRTSFLFSLIAAAALLPGCFPSAPQQISAFRAPELRTEATFKVISLNSNDPVLNLIEQELLTRGFKVISDNYLRSQTAPVGNMTVTTRDTTYNTTQFRDVSMEMFQEKPADYVIRYSLAWRHSNRFPDYFNASVINTVSGAIEFTYNFNQGAYATGALRDSHSVIRDFASKMQVK